MRSASSRDEQSGKPADTSPIPAFIIKLLGISLLLIGFIWLLMETSLFSARAYTLSIWHTQNLPAGDTIPRTEAATALRALSLKLKDRQGDMISPALLMLAGGLMAAFAQRSPKPAP